MKNSFVSTSLQSPDWSLRLSSSHLAWLLEFSDKQSDLSPRPMLTQPQQPGPVEIQQLVAAEIISAAHPGKPELTARGQQVTAILNASATSITLRLWGSEQASAETTAYFPGNLCGEPGVLLCRDVDSKWLVGGMADVSHLISAASLMVPSEPEEWLGKLQFEAHLDHATAAVLCALFDIARTAYRRQQFPDTGLEPGTAFSVGDISGYLQSSWGVSGFDQLISYLPATAMQGDPPGLTEIDSAVNTLIAHDYCHESITGRLVIGEQLRELIPALYGLRAGLQWLRTSLLPSDETAVANRVFVIGPGGAVLLFNPTVSGHVLIKLAASGEMARFLAEEASMILELRQPEQLVNQVTTCPHCQAHCPHAARFCSQCGAQLVKEKENDGKNDEAQLCKTCSGPLRAGARFCTRCGESVQPAS